jgi:hypothetical protein
VLRLLWSGDAAGVSFQGEFFSLAAACSFPKPHDGRSCRSISAGRAWLLPGGQAAGATATSPYRRCRRTSSASLSASPMKLKATTVKTMQRPAG